MTTKMQLITSIIHTRFGKMRVIESDSVIHEVQFLGKDDDVEVSRPLGELAALAARCIDKLCWDEAKLPLYYKGTECQQAVWRELMRIPKGTTITYAELAKRIGKPAAVRAVANACGRNRIALLIPCHRVVASNGKLGGYSCPLGISMKKCILDAESNSMLKENVQ